jgi:hypothetical protein
MLHQLRTKERSGIGRKNKEHPEAGSRFAFAGHGLLDKRLNFGTNSQAPILFRVRLRLFTSWKLLERSVSSFCLSTAAFGGGLLIDLYRP